MRNCSTCRGTIFDFCRAVEPSYQRKDAKEYLHRAGGKLSKLRRVATLFAEQHRRVSDHTNFQMAALSLNGCVQQIEEVLAALKPDGATAPPAGVGDEDFAG